MPADRKPAQAWIKGGGISAAIVAAIAAYEGFAPKAMIPVKEDRPTIGYGSTMYENGAPVKMGDTITRERAQILLKDVADAKAQRMIKCLGDVPLYEWEWNAYVSFTYNVGEAAFCGSTLLKKLKQKPPDYSGACKELLRWDKVKGKVVKGLTRRRQDEYRMCIGESN
jgi:lysozyme